MSTQSTDTSLGCQRLAAMNSVMGLAKLRRCNAGMTLIEVLAALALFALLSTVLLMAFRLATHSYRTVVRLNLGSWHVVTSQRFLRRILESAYPLEPVPGTLAYGIEGTGSSLAVTAPMPTAAGAMGFYRYVFTLQKRPDGFVDLVVKTTLAQDGFSSPRRLVGSAGLSHEVLLARITSARWSYLAPHNDNLDAAPQSNWVDTWQQPMAPLLVRLRVTFPPDDARVWPEFLVHPQITNDAQCQFDAVSQVCRQVGR